MKAKILFSLFLLFSSVLSSIAGGKVKFKVGVDAGYDYYIGDRHDPRYVKQLGAFTDKEESYSNYNPLFSGDGVDHLKSWYVGVTGEFLFRRERFGVTTGFRYTQFIDVYDPDAAYFYWNYSSEEASTYYVKAQSLLQRNHYIGFPLEFRYLASRPGRICRFYFKIGSSWGFLMASDNKITCYDPTVDGELGGYSDDVGKDPDHFIGSVYPAFGFRIGRYYPLVNIDFHLPSFLINMPTSYFYHDIGVGMQLSVQLPTDRDSYDRREPMGTPYY